MKKIVIISALLVSLLASCESGCGCPGGAGYGQIDTETTCKG